MRKICLSIFSMMFFVVAVAQTKEVDKAKDFLEEYLKLRKSSDIEMAYASISTGMKLEKNLTNPYAYFYNGKIIKLYYDDKGMTSKKDLVIEAYRSLSKTLELNPQFSERNEVLKLIQFICFDLYNEGIFLFKESKHEEAYNVYKDLFSAQELLKKNNLKIEMLGANNTSAVLTDADIMNNYAIFCINSGKIGEAKEILINEVKTSPTAPKYAQLINLLKKLQDGSTADAYILEAYEKFPNDLDVLILSINYHIEKKNLEQALRQVTTAIKMKPMNYEFYLVQGQIYADMEQYKSSVDAYKAGLALFPNNYDLNYNLGRALFNKGTELYNKMDVKLKPEATASLEESKTYFLKAKSLDPTKVDIDKIIDDINHIK